MMRMTEVVKNLLIINTLVFIVTFLVPDYFANLFGISGTDCYQGSMERFFAIYYPGSDCFRPFQLVTNMFSHGGFYHFALNMMSLYFIGPIVEMTLREKRFLALYLFSGLGGTLFYIAKQAAVLYFGTGSFDIIPFDLYTVQDQVNAAAMATYAPALGASGAISGLLVALGITNPNLKLYMMFIPVPIKAKHLAIFGAAMSLVLGVVGFPGSIGGIAHFAHLGGMVFAYLFFIKERGLTPW